MIPKGPENAANRISERLKFKISRGGGMPPNPLATPACLGWPFGLATALTMVDSELQVKLLKQETKTWNLFGKIAAK